jgi:methionyl-tRNA formyltransferase
MSGTDGPIRIVFFGTPGYAVPALEALLAFPGVHVSLVVTQPDRPAGRHRELRVSEVKAAAQRAGLPVYQPESLRVAAARIPLERQGAGIFIVGAYGLIFGRKTLAIPRWGCLNLHASLLPKYRGASPVTAAILAGDAETGVTLMRMDAGLDTGDILAAASVGISPRDTTESLTARLAEVGAQLLVANLSAWITGEIEPQPQSSAGASLARPLVKADGAIDWSSEAVLTERQIRAMQPWPRAFATLPDGASMHILGASLGEPAPNEIPGTVRVSGPNVSVACGRGSLLLERVQPAGSSVMVAAALVNGRRLKNGDRLENGPAPGQRDPIVRPVR